MKAISYLALCVFVVCGVLLGFSLEGNEWNLVFPYSAGVLLATLLIFVNNKIYKKNE